MGANTHDVPVAAWLGRWNRSGWAAALLADGLLVLVAHLLVVVIGARTLPSSPFGELLLGLAFAVTAAGLVRAAVNRSALIAGEMPGPSRPTVFGAVLAVVVLGLTAAALGAPTWLVAVPVAIGLLVQDRLRHVAIGDRRPGVLLLADAVWVAAGVAVVVVDDVGSYAVGFELETEQGALVLWAVGACLSAVVLSLGLEEVASGESFVGPRWVWHLGRHLLPVGGLAVSGLLSATALPAPERAPVLLAVALFAPVAAVLSLLSRSIPGSRQAARSVAVVGLIGAFTMLLLPDPWLRPLLAGHRPEPMTAAMVALVVTVWFATRALSDGRVVGRMPPSGWPREAMALGVAGIAAFGVARLTGSAMATATPLLAGGCWLAVAQLRDTLLSPTAAPGPLLPPDSTLI